MAKSNPGPHRPRDAGPGALALLLQSRSQPAQRCPAAALGTPVESQALQGTGPGFADHSTTGVLGVPESYSSTWRGRTSCLAHAAWRCLGGGQLRTRAPPPRRRSSAKAESSSCGSHLEVVLPAWLPVSPWTSPGKTRVRHCPRSPRTPASSPRGATPSAFPRCRAFLSQRHSPIPVSLLYPWAGTPVSVLGTKPVQTPLLRSLSASVPELAAFVPGPGLAPEPPLVPAWCQLTHLTTEAGRA